MKGAIQINFINIITLKVCNYIVSALKLSFLQSWYYLAFVSSNKMFILLKM